MRVTKRFEIDAGHRLMNHAGKCRSVHGHRYAFEVTLSGVRGADGMVVDFGVVKERVGALLARWDHAFIYQVGDPIGMWLKEHDQKVHELPVPPTAENLAGTLLYDAQMMMPEVHVVSVRCVETPTSWADAVAVEGP